MRQPVAPQLRPDIAVATLAFGLAVAVAAYVVRPFQAGTLGFDAAASVLYFDRILAGRHLETFLGATPKPLLTVLYGAVHAVVPDWRAISVLAIVAYASAIAAATTLAFRLAGIAAAAFVAIGLVGSAKLLQDVDAAYAVSWALLCWSAAGLLVSADRPRYGLAGLALALGGLARFETLIVTGAAALLLAGAAGAALARRSGWGPVRARLPLLLGALTLPVQALHDWLLTGNPAYSQTVPVLGSVGLPLSGVDGVIAAIRAHYAPEPGLVLLALLGVPLLVRRDRHVAAGSLALALGVLLFLVSLGQAGIFVSDRYFAPVDLALIFVAGIGLGSLRVSSLTARLAALRRPARRATLPVLATVAGGLAALALVRPFGPLDRATRRDANFNGVLHADVERLTPTIQAALAAAGARPPALDDGDGTGPTGSQAVVLVPVLTVPQLAVDLDLPLSAIGGTDGARVAVDGTYPKAGQLVLHYAGRDDPPSAFEVFEVDRPTQEGAIEIDPVRVDPAGRFWLVRIR
ncbi:MAG TPA: hypothetical protein VF763_12325 [Candidatus Limnocylindrales bacterium]